MTLTEQIIEAVEMLSPEEKAEVLDHARRLRKLLKRTSSTGEPVLRSNRRSEVIGSCRGGPSLTPEALREARMEMWGTFLMGE